jgi:CyaY protein
MEVEDLALMDAAWAASVAVAFKRLVAAADAIDPDELECDATADMVTMTAPKTGKKVIITTQRAVSQIWVAGNGSGIHFSCTPDGRWLDDKGKGIELHQWVSDCVYDAAGLTLSFPT